MKIKELLFTLGSFLLPATSVFAQALSGLPNPGLTSSYIQIPNASSTGTTLFTLTKLTTVSSLSNAVITATTDAAGVVGVAVNGVGTSGSVLIQTNGLVYCVFNNATTAGDYVGISSSATGDASPTAGNCHDVGFGPPAAPPNGQLIGQVLATNAGAGTYVVRLSLAAQSRTVWLAQGTVAPTSATQFFFAPNGIMQQTTSETVNATTQPTMIAPFAGTIENLRCGVNVIQGGGITDTFTVRTGTFPATSMSASTVTVTTAANSTTPVVDNTHSVAVTAGQAIDIGDTSSGSAAARTAVCSVEFVF